MITNLKILHSITWIFYDRMKKEQLLIPLFEKELHKMNHNLDI